MGKRIGIDLGTSNTLIYVGGEGIVLRASSVVAVEKQTNRVMAVGRDAKRMVGRTPGSIRAYRPLQGGVVADFDITTMMLHKFFQKLGLISFFSRPSVILCMPCGVTESEKRTLKDAGFEAGAREVALIEAPIAGAIGSGLHVESPRGCMTVDVGGGTTESAVLSLGGIVSSRMVRVAGDKLDESIIEYVKDRHGLLIGEATAEALKRRIGSVHPAFDKGRSMTVYGRSLKTRLGAELTITAAELREAMKQDVTVMVESVKETLEDTPPALSADLFDYGVMLTGGGAMLAGLPALITKRTGVRVTVAKRSIDKVCLGIGRVIESSDEYAEAIRFEQK